MPTSYRDLDVWKCSLLLVTEVYRVTKNLPPDERFGLTAQMRRAAVSDHRATSPKVTVGRRGANT